MGRRWDRLGRWAARQRISLERWRWPQGRWWARGAGPALAAAGVAVALAAGLSLFVTRQGPAQAPAPEPRPAVNQPAGSRPVVSQPPAAATPDQGTAPAAVPAATGASDATPALQRPVQGQVLRGYGWSYSSSFGDWRFHDGVDFGSAAGQPVMAAAGGTVSAVDEDPLWGSTVRLQHAGGLVTVYRGLAKTSVKVGQGVTAGQTIGWLGDPPAAEAGEPPHLHWEAWRGDKPVDPGTVLTLGSPPSG